MAEPELGHQESQRPYPQESPAAAPERQHVTRLIIALILTLTAVTVAALYGEQWMTESQQGDTIRQCQYVESECPDHG